MKMNETRKAKMRKAALLVVALIKAWGDRNEEAPWSLVIGLE